MIPSEAKKVFSGVIFDVYQWQQEMFDGTFETFEKLKRQDTVEVIMTTFDQKMLIVRQQQADHDEWFESLPGGRVEAGEDALTAAKREILEETGYTSDEWELVDSTQSSSKIEWTLFVYVARNCCKVAEQHLDAGERIEVIKCSFDEFVKRFELKRKHVADWVRESCIRAAYDKQQKTLLKNKVFGG